MNKMTLMELNQNRQAKGATLAYFGNGKVVYEYKKGIQPLLDLATSNEDFENFIFSDSIVGKGASLLYAHMKVAGVYGQVISKQAIKVLEQYNIKYQYSTITEYIINRKNTGMCPIETSVININNPAESISVIKQTLLNLAIKK